MNFKKGSGSGSGFGNRRGKGQARRNKGLGPEGKCVCPNCGTEVAHQRGIPCYEQTCPECGSTMVRSELSDQSNNQNTTSKNNTNQNSNIPTIDKEKCTGCGQCIDACPFDAISLINGKAEIDASLCRSCNKCIRSCPVRAITP